VALISFAYPALPAVIPAGMGIVSDGGDARHVWIPEVGIPIPKSRQVPDAGGITAGSR